MKIPWETRPIGYIVLGRLFLGLGGIFVFPWTKPKRGEKVGGNEPSAPKTTNPSKATIVDVKRIGHPTDRGVLQKKGWGETGQNARRTSRGKGDILEKTSG